MTDFLDVWDAQRNPQPQTTSRPVVPRADGQAQAYALAALESEADRVASIPIGSGRNHALNTAAFRLGQLIAAGAIDEATVTQVLGAADGGLHFKATRDTIASGIAAGQTQARAIPEPTTPTRSAPWETPPVVSDDPFADIYTGPQPGRPGSSSAAPAVATNADGTAPSASDPHAPPSSTPTTTHATGDPDPLLALEVQKQRRARAARTLIDQEDARRTWRAPDYVLTLTDELDLPDEPVTYRVDQLIPTGGNVLLAAQFKAGKTTLVSNLARSLADAEPFLGRFAVDAVTGRVAIFNYEVSRGQYRRWLRDIGITDTDRVAVLPLRGFRLPILVPYVEDWIVDYLQRVEAEVWIVDPFARAASGSVTSENDNSEVGQFLETLDVIKERAGVSELILPTHTGRAEHEQGDERARGATRLDDWADVRWLLTKDKGDTRYFRATGRDVETDEAALEFDANTRLLTLTGGDRQTNARNRVRDAIVECVGNRPGIGVSDLRTGVRQIVGTVGQRAVDAAVESLIYDRKIHIERTGRANGHYLGAGQMIKSDPFD